MTKKLYDISIKGEGGKFYPIGCVNNKNKVSALYDEYIRSGGVKGELLVTERTHHLYLTVGR